MNGESVCLCVCVKEQKEGKMVCFHLWIDNNNNNNSYSLYAHTH